MRPCRCFIDFEDGAARGVHHEPRPRVIPRARQWQCPCATEYYTDPRDTCRVCDELKSQMRDMKEVQDIRRSREAGCIICTVLCTALEGHKHLWEHVGESEIKAKLEVTVDNVVYLSLWRFVTESREDAQIWSISSSIPILVCRHFAILRLKED
jgi:hypothetical protein